MFDKNPDINLTQWHSDFFPEVSKKRSSKNIKNLKAWHLNSVIAISFFQCRNWINLEEICGNMDLMVG